MAAMISTHIRHGDLVIDMDTNGDVQICRQSTAQAVRMSLSEWTYLIHVAELHGWPIVPPTQPYTEVIP